ncbi:DNA (cytosine-5)-methyltransferase 1 [Prosthecobacter fusiformis]|uniref:Cytosine-specific methyltransferase n=1 Tax=Prosthecobacter fusiformis TaxID=48464 RepID=A0A4R7RK66_9BACT|nr:DNA cytosine methyltransferase [Prosthecobacter fusiformis]TDU62577.1 DNA (cytosine-5)-methyltransferase 1 [Prosthecobacter fusiformis]
MSFYSLELCAGGGGQALGLEGAGFHHVGVVEYEPQFCTTLRMNRPHWNVIQQDIRDFQPSGFGDVDLIAGGVPCPPFSIAGKQLGSDDERDMFPTALDIISKVRPRAIMLENVQGLASAKFRDYRNDLLKKLGKMGYEAEWKVLQASDFGVPQLRPRFILVGMRADDMRHFSWPEPALSAPTVGETLVDLMGANGWLGTEEWVAKANRIAPTLVGGSKKHGGPDLGPTRAKRQWRELGVDGMGLADEAPDVTTPEDKLPRLTVRMVARIQGFPDEWQFSGKKTASYRQVGNAFPPPVARAVGRRIIAAFKRLKADAKYGHAEAQLRLFEEPAKMSWKRKKAPKL